MVHVPARTSGDYRREQINFVKCLGFHLLMAQGRAAYGVGGSFLNVSISQS